jgi:hypothetical protein
MGQMRKVLQAWSVALVALGAAGCSQQGYPEQAEATGSASVQWETQLARISALETENALLATRVARQGEVISYLATQIPPWASTPQLVTPAPNRGFEGAVSIENGKCCVAGAAGQELAVLVEFTARSGYARVTDMRVATGLGSLDSSAIDKAEWEPFSPQKAYTITPSSNWVGFYVAVQFRDALGNLSQVFRSDISVEGSPSAPSTTPGT